MPQRLIQVITPARHVPSVKAIVKRSNVLDCWHIGRDHDDERSQVDILVSTESSQYVLNALYALLDRSSDTRVLILPVHATMPVSEAKKETDDEDKPRFLGISREELFQQTTKGAILSQSFIMMVILSTIVAGIGLIENNIAVVIGAMVIAPLLGPNIALALAAALGDIKLMWQSFATTIVGISIAIGMAWLAGRYGNFSLDSQELTNRTIVHYSDMALALVSGAAAVLSLTYGASSSLVGVMVAVALLPPAATAGLMLGAGNLQAGLGALTLLAVNIVCVNLAAKLVFVLKGVTPRLWYEKSKARHAISISIVFWVVTLSLLALLVYTGSPILTK